MSSSTVIGSFKSKTDKLRKETDLKKLLKLNAKLNTQAEQAIKQNIGIVPTTATITQRVETDINRMRDEVIRRLSGSLGENQAKQFALRYILSPNDLVAFYYDMDYFLKQLQPDRPLTASYFYNEYVRWKRLSNIDATYDRIYNFITEGDYTAQEEKDLKKKLKEAFKKAEKDRDPTPLMDLQKNFLSGAGICTLDPTIQTEVSRLAHVGKTRVLESGLTPSLQSKYIRQLEDAMHTFDMGTIKKIAGGRL